MKIEIKNRWTMSVIFSCEADSLRLAVQMAVKQGVSLRDANLSDANLSAANLSDADLRDANLSAANLSDADLRDADLSAANLSAANLRAADLSAANLSDANLSAADLRDANLRDANLRAANLRAADLRAANLRAANLRDAKNDFFAVLLHTKHEVDGLASALREGRVDGSVYEDECACLVGTLANVKGCQYDAIPGLWPDSNRPAERFFLAIRKGDTPENSSIVKLTLEWIEEFSKLLVA